MDHHATVHRPIGAVFCHLAEPRCLGNWLRDARCPAPGDAARPAPDGSFALILGEDGKEIAATGEVVAYEPPWQVAFRVCGGPRAHLIRVTCTACAGGTRVHVHQRGGGLPLAVDLTGLAPDNSNGESQR